MYGNTQIKIDKGVKISHNQPGRKFGSGKSEEYTIGTDIYNRFNIEDSAFFTFEINPKSVLSRLKRLNNRYETDRVYVTRSETQEEIYKGVGELSGMKISIEGFRIHRIK